MSLGGYALVRAFTANSPMSGLLANVHALEAVSNLSVELSLVLIGPGASFGLDLAKEIVADTAVGAGEATGTGLAVGAGEAASAGVAVGLVRQ
jgi:hypothetical protein